MAAYTHPGRCEDGNLWVSHEQKINDFANETYHRVARQYCEKHKHFFYTSDLPTKVKDPNDLYNEMMKQNMFKSKDKRSITFKNGILSCNDDQKEMERFENMIRKHFKKACKILKSKVDFGDGYIMIEPVSQKFYLIMRVIENDDGSETFDIEIFIPKTEEAEQLYKRIVNFCNAKYEIKQRYHDILVKVVDEYARNTEKHETPKITIVPENALECGDLCSLQHGINSSTKDITVYEDGSLNEHGIEDVLTYLAKSFICSLVPLSNDGFDFKIIRSYIDVESNHKTPTATLYITTDHHIIAIEKEEKHEKEDQQEEEEKGINEKKME